MSAKISFNPENTLVEIETPEGSYGPMDVPDEGDPIMLVDEEDPNALSYICIVGEYEGLKANTLYKLVPVETTVEENVDFDDDEEEEEEDDEVLVED
jgi:hypothetical protein